MKKLFFLLIVFVAVSNASSGQTGNPVNLNAALSSAYPENKAIRNLSAALPDDPKDANYYMHRSRNMRITGLSLLGAGLLLGGAGLIVATTDHASDYEAQDRADATAGVLFVCSATTGIASIPLMIISHSYRAKARRMDVSAQKTSIYIPGKTTKNMIGLSLQFSINS